MVALKHEPNLSHPDDVYNLIVDAHKGLDEARCRAFDARLILLLANHVGDTDVIREAVAAAGAGLTPAP